jgi:hypothetical protein
MDSAQVRILEKMHEERFRALLQRLDSLRLPAEEFSICYELESNFSDLEWEKGQQCILRTETTQRVHLIVEASVQDGYRVLVTYDS